MITLEKPNSRGIPAGAVLDIGTTWEPRAEWNHSCTSQCPSPCPASSRLTAPEVGGREIVQPQG